MVCQAKAPDAISWYRPHLDTSFDLITAALPNRDVTIIDIGGGGATLIDDLFGQGYRQLSVLDILHSAINVARQRLGIQAQLVTWLA